MHATSILRDVVDEPEMSEAAEQGQFINGTIVEPQLPNLALRPATMTLAQFAEYKAALLVKGGGTYVVEFVPTVTGRYENIRGRVTATVPLCLLTGEQPTVGATMKDRDLPGMAKDLAALGFALPEDEDRRNKVLRSQYATVYLTQAGTWAVERRINPNPHTLYDHENREVGLNPAGDHLRLTDAMMPHFHDLVAGREKHGNIVAAQTRNNVHGVYVGDGLKPDGTLTGYGLEGVKPDAIRVTEFNPDYPVLSQSPQAPKHQLPGLNYVHAHAMGMAIFQDDKWGPTHIMPSGKVALPLTNTTAAQYAQGGFEGLQGKFVENGLSVEDAGQAAMETIADDPDTIQVTIKNGEISLFRLEENAKRLQETAEGLGMPPVSIEQFLQTVLEVVKRNLKYIPMKDGQLYIRPYILGTRGGAGANAAKEYIFGVEVFPYGNYLSGKDGSISVEGRLDLHRPETTGDIKSSSNYAAYFMDKAGAKQRGYNDILCFNKKGEVEEYSSAAPVLVGEDPETGELILVTPPMTAEEMGDSAQEDEMPEFHSLNSITRRSVIELARRMGIKVEIRPIHYSEMPKMLGLFTTGTAAGITRVGKMDIKQNPEDQSPLKCEFNDPRATALIGELYDKLMQARAGTLDDERLSDLNDQWVTKIPANSSEVMAEA